ncbi:MAG TPA: SGNH/GDSL hydrolase family protein [Xanthobacteraceae bacterium]|nr:SGNH/GDSL hydrolase family protein [Xanthobacteraceae bacterium]
MASLFRARRANPLLVAGLLAAVAVPAGAASLPAICPASTALTRLEAPLPRLAAKLAANEPVVIVAIGSSSTAGAGTSAPGRDYPSRLEAALAERFPANRIRVVNRGINGQDGPEMLARFDADVGALQPTLVIWQGGVNALFRDNGLATAETILREAIRRTRALNADFLLLDPQYAPRVLADADTAPMVALLNTVARDEGVPVFHRFALMQDWHQRAGLPFDAFLAADSFHMNDWSYNCLGRDLAQAVAGDIRPAALPATDAAVRTAAQPAVLPASAAPVARTTAAN